MSFILMYFFIYFFYFFPCLFYSNGDQTHAHRGIYIYKFNPAYLDCLGINLFLMGLLHAEDSMFLIIIRCLHFVARYKKDSYF